MYCPACGRPLPHDPPVSCLDCGARHWHNAKPCAGALVVHRQRLLLVRRAHQPFLDAWDIPGGFCEAEEHPARAAMREVFEETGLRVRLIGFLGIWIDRYGDERDGGLPTITHNAYYHAVPAGGIATRLDPAEVAEAGWFEPEALPERLAFPDHSLAVLAAWRRAMRAGGTVTPLLDVVDRRDRPA